MKPSLRSSCRRALPLALPLVLGFAFLAILKQQPEADHRPIAAPANAGHVVAVKFRAEDAAALDTFDAWLAAGRHSETLARGVELAQARRAALKQLIQVDPQAALEKAVPYALRRELPEQIVDLLENPVSTTADLDVEIACGVPVLGSYRQQWITLDGERLRVFTYGERDEVMTKKKLSVHGIAIDEVMAMWDDPLREWSPEEVAAQGHTGRIAQLGKRLLEIESDEALESARQQLRETEQMLGAVTLPAYRDLALGEMEGMFPLAMRNGGDGSNDDDLPPIAYSPATEGAKKILYIRARFANQASGFVPVSLEDAQSAQGGAENFWRDNSYGKSTLTTTYTSVVTLPKNGSDYLGNFFILLADARQAALAADSNWNHNNYDFYTVITSNVTGGFGYIGIAQLNDKGSHLLSNFISVRNASHEYGHNLGLQHSGYWLTDSTSPIGRDSIPGGYVGDAADAERNEYGHKFAVMGSQDNSDDFEQGRVHYAASDKNRLDWLVQADGDIVSTTTSGTFRLYRHDVQAADFGTMTPNVARAIKINLNASDPTGLPNPYRYWLNYRLLPTDGIAGNWLPHGLQVDWRRDGGAPRPVLLDMTPYSRDSGPYGTSPGPAADNNDKEDSVLLIGRTFSDTGANIHFTPIAKGGTHPNQWLDVVVNIGTQGNNAAPVISNFTVTNPNPATGQVINFNVTATDPDGDTLAYHWDMGDNLVQAPQLNLPTRGKQWGTAGYYVVRVEVSDMKGGKTTASRVIRVGSPANNGMIHGRVTHAGRPVEGALIRGGDINTWTDSEGAYVLPGLPLGNATVTAAKAGLTFTALFTNPVQATAFGAFGIDFAANEPWTGGGGTVAIVRPQRIDVPVGFAAQFIAEAFDNSGNPVVFNPTWSVTGGGTINSNGVFSALSVGGPFTVTAEDGAMVATAQVTVVDIGGPPLANGTWTNTAGGSWATNGNWAGSTIAAGAGNTADFSTLNPTADTTVTLDAPRAIGTLIFGDTNTSSAATWFLTNGTGGSLMLAGANPAITVNPMGAGKFANIAARLSGFSGFTKNGSGNLILNNNTNTLTGPIVINAGNIQLNSASLTNATSVAINAGALVVATSAANAVGGTITFGGGNLQFNNPPGSDYSALFNTAPNQSYRISVGSTHEATFNSNLASSNGTLTKLGTGTLILGASNSYSGGTTLSVGTLRFGNAAALGSGPLAITGNTILQAGLAATLSNAVSIATGITGTVDTNSNNTTLSGTSPAPAA
jgi:autotransporter-associated beta strand protein